MAVGYGNLAILTQGIAGTSPYGMITGAADIGYSNGAMTGAGAISLGDILSNPSAAFSTMNANVSANAASMMIQAITFNAGAKIFRISVAVRTPSKTTFSFDCFPPTC